MFACATAISSNSAQAQAPAPNTSHLGKEAPPPRAPSHSDEHIVMPKFPSGWADQPVQPGMIEVAEFVPKGQTAVEWSSKITLEIHHDSNTLPIDAFQRRALSSIRENCTGGVIEGRLQTGVNNGFPSAFWNLGCKKDSRGAFGEVRYTKAVQGQDSLYLLSWAWRTAPFPSGAPPVTQQQIEEAVDFLKTSVVCANSPAHPCPGAAPAPK
jgi:hypothetical protein